MPHMLHRVPRQAQSYDLVPVKTLDMLSMSWKHCWKILTKPWKWSQMSTVSSKDWTTFATERRIHRIFEIFKLSGINATCHEHAEFINKRKEYKNHQLVEGTEQKKLATIWLEKETRKILTGQYKIFNTNRKAQKRVKVKGKWSETFFLIRLWTWYQPWRC